MRKMKYIIGILLLFMVIGFATVTVTLSITGNVKITSDVDNFKVYFSEVKVNDVQDLTLVKTETELSFNTELASIGNTYEITYDVTNASTMFDAELSINCTEGDEYLSIINEFDTSNLEALSTRTGILTLKKIKSNANETSNEYTITCNIIAIPVERTEEATGEVPPPLESLMAMSEEEVILSDITASPWESYDGGELETVSATNTLFKPSFLTEAAAVIPEASLLVSYDGGSLTFDNGDQVRVQNTRCLTNDNDNVATYVANEYGWEPIDTTDAVYWCEEGVENEFIAYYPATESSSYQMFTIPTDQSTLALLAAADWMTASTSAIIMPDNRTINYTFQHMLSKVTISLALSNQFTEVQVINNLEVYSLGSKLTRKSNGEVEVEKNEPYGISAYNENDYTFTAYISPGEYKSQEKFISVYVDGDEFEVLIPEDIELESGIHYTFNIKVGKDIFTIEQVSISDIDTPFGNGWNTEEDLGVGSLSISNTIQDVGKTAWELGDQLFVTLTSDYYGTQTGVLTYNGDGEWNADVYFSYFEEETPSVSAIYAPGYELIEDGTLKLKDNVKHGMTEYIAAECEIVNEVLNISFTDVGRLYSRLHIVGESNTTYTVTISENGFIPAGATLSATDPYTITTDSNGNTYLYGTFAENARVSVTKGELVLVNYTFPENSGGTDYETSYLLDARVVIDGTLGGKTEATEEEVNALVEQLKDYVDNGLSTVIVTGSEPAMIDNGSWTTTVIGEALYRLTNEDSTSLYCSKIDLTLFDVTEITESEFNSVYALNSITLPKVTSIGDGAFYGATYLQNITFGSVVTSIEQNNWDVFGNVGYNVGDCDLTLNAKQVNAETDYQPNIENKTWWNTTWKSITLK